MSIHEKQNILISFPLSLSHVCVCVVSYILVLVFIYMVWSLQLSYYWCLLIISEGSTYPAVVTCLVFHFSSFTAFSFLYTFSVLRFPVDGFSSFQQGTILMIKEGTPKERKPFGNRLYPFKDLCTISLYSVEYATML